MKVLLGVIFLTWGVLAVCHPVSAMDVEIDELTFRASCQENGELSSTYELRTIVENDWFQLQTAARIYGSGSNYYTIDNYFTVEKDQRHFEADFGAAESVDYTFVNYGAGYQGKILGNWRAEIAWEMENRLPKGMKGSFYRADSEQIELKYQGNPFQYSVRFHRQGKDYPVSAQYTSLKYTLENTIAWAPCPFLGLDASYQEDSGAYPHWTTQNYWKTKWGVGGHWIPSPLWTLDLNYSKQEWFKGFFPYRRDTQVRSEFQFKPGIFSKWSLSASLHGLDYCDSDNPLLDPGEWLTDETKSRLEEKLDLEYCFKRGIFTWTLGYFIERADFQSNAVADKQDAAYYTSLGWSFQKIRLNVSMSPGGSIGNRYPRYQLVVGYNPH